MTQNLRLKSIFVFFLGGSSFGWKDAARHAAKPAAPWRPLLSMWSSCAVNICRRHINKSLRKTHQGGIFRARYTESDCDTELQGHTNRKQTRPMLYMPVVMNHVLQHPIKRRYAGAWKDCRSLFGLRHAEPLWASEETLLPQCLSVQVCQCVSYFTADVKMSEPIRQSSQ